MVKVLVIDDDPYIRRLYRRIFVFEKYEVEMAENGIEGIRKAIQFVPSLIVLDIFMDGMDGVEVLKRLKSNKKTKDIPVLMLTAVTDDWHMKECNRLGADGYLMKSEYTPQQVVDEVKKLIKEISH